MITGGIVVASNVYYGICTTAGDTQNKQVQLVNVSSELEGFHLQKGDILSVYFVNKNEANGVTLTLFIGDINQEYNSNTSVDESGFNTSTIGVAPGAWTDGEVVIFSYTHNGSVVENADNNYYWEMVGKPIATSDTYGDVLFDKVNEEDGSPALSKNKIDQLIASKGVNFLSYDSYADEQLIGELYLNTRYPNGTIETDQENSIIIKTPKIPKDTGDLTNEAGYIKNEIGTNLTFTGGSKQIKVRNNGSDTTIIDLCDSSSAPEPPDVTINSLGNINLNPTGHVNITLPTNKQLNVSGGDGIACDKLDSADLFVDDITAHTSAGTITFHSPVNLPNGLSANGLQLTSDSNVTIGSTSLPNYLGSFLTNNATRLNSWLADQLDGYLYTRRIHSQTGQITAGGTFMVELGGGAQHAYTSNIQPGDTESESTTANLNLPGYDIVGIIAWETWGSNYACTNICSVYWNNNDPSTGFLKLRVSSSKNIPSTRVSADILYKKKLRIIEE